MKMQPTKFGGSPSPGFGGGFGSGGGLPNDQKTSPLSSAFGVGPGPGMMKGGAKTSFSPPGVSGVNKGVPGVGLSSTIFGGESGPTVGTRGTMKGKQSSTFGSSFPPGLGAGGGTTKNSNPTMSEGLGDKDAMKMQPTKFGGWPSPGFGGGFGSGSSAFGMGPGPGMMSDGAKTSLSPPSVTGVNKGVQDIDLSSSGFGGECPVNASNFAWGSSGRNTGLRHATRNKVVAGI